MDGVQSTISSNGDYGMYLEDTSNYNEIWHNNIIGNNGGNVQAYDDAGNNYWDNGSVGNYWDDYEDRYPSATNDGTVWDTPYEINGTGLAEDEYPQVDPVP